MVQFGVHLGTEGMPMPQLRQAWRDIEGIGFDWISVWDHFNPMLQPDGIPTYEAVTCHTALALTTTRVRVGSCVYSVGFRHPSMLARAATTIDHLSGGRLELGIGTGWDKDEYDAYGFELEPRPVRLRRLREYAEVIRRLWTEDEVHHSGEFYELRGTRCNPKPLQQAPRLWIGAKGDQVGIKIAAAVGDGWNCTGTSAADFKRKRAVIMDTTPRPERMATAAQLTLLFTDQDVEAGLARRVGPALAQRLGGPTGMIYGSTQRVIDMAAEYVRAGADWIILRLLPPLDLDELRMFVAEVVPHLVDITPDDHVVQASAG